MISAFIDFQSMEDYFYLYLTLISHFQKKSVVTMFSSHTIDTCVIGTSISYNLQYNVIIKKFAQRNLPLKFYRTSDAKYMLSAII